MESFFLIASCGGMAIASLTAPLGCFLLWRRMAYFSDALSHSALLGVVLSLIMNLPIPTGIMAISLLFAITIFLVQQRRFLSTDMTLGLIAQISIATALLLLYHFGSVRVDLMSYLFGDILAIGKDDVTMMVIGAAVILVWLYSSWPTLLITSANEDLARAQQLNPNQSQMVFLVVLAFVIAVSIKLVGVLLMTSLLLIPAAAARNISRTPEQMVLWAMIIGLLGMLFGLATSWHFNTPTGPTIVLTLAFFLIPCRLFQTH